MSRLLLTKSCEPFFSVTQVWLSLLTMTLYEVTQSLLSTEEKKLRIRGKKRDIPCKCKWQWGSSSAHIQTRLILTGWKSVKEQENGSGGGQRIYIKSVTWGFYYLKFGNADKTEVCRADDFLLEFKCWIPGNFSLIIRLNCHFVSLHSFFRIAEQIRNVDGDSEV